MAARGNESPMDFQWQTHAPGDMTSPFHRLAMDHNQHDKKRPHSVFDSPSKPDPWQSSFGLPQSPSNPPQSAFRAPSFTTPRKPVEIDFSSGPENQSSPEQADSEETPESARPSHFQFTSNENKGKRNSLFGIYGRFAPSSGRGEIRTKHDALERRIHKRRKRGDKFDRRVILGGRRESSEESDEETSPVEPKEPPIPPPQNVGYLTTLFTFIESYPNAPALLAKYLQLAFNAAILCGCLYVILSFWQAIQSDVNRASEDAASEQLAEIAACTKNYVDNKCASQNRMPALENVCDNWALCMNRDPNAVKRAALSAHTFAEILNSFVEPISFKTMIFSVMIVVASLAISNATFGLLRKAPFDHQQHEASRMPSGSFAQSPQQQHLYGLGPYGQYGQHGLDWHQNGLQQNWNPPPGETFSSPQKLDRTRSRSPQKRINYQ